jgi:hypothetical protein
MFCRLDPGGKAHFVIPEGSGRGTARCKMRSAAWVHLLRPSTYHNAKLTDYVDSVYCKNCKARSFR